MIAPANRWLAIFARTESFRRFMLVGLLNTAVGYGLFYLALVVLGRPVHALALATVGGMLFNFMSTGSLVFSQADARRLPRFVVTYGTIFTLNALLLSAAVACGMSAAVAQLGLTVLMTVPSYLLMRHWVFGAATCQR